MIGKFIIITALILCFVGAEIRNNTDITEEEFYNATSKVTYDNMNFTFKEESDNQNNTFIVRSVMKYADFMTFFTVNGANKALEYGYENPQYNYELAWKLLFLSIFAVLIIPGIYFITFIGYFVVLIYKKIKDIINKSK